MLTAILFTGMLAVAQTPKLAQAPQPPQAPPIAKLAEQVNPPKVKFAQMSDDYASARLRAIGQGKPIVIFVRMDKRPIDGAVSVRVDSLDGYDLTPAIIVGAPDAKHGMRWVATLPSTATDTRIVREMGGSLQAIPFFQRLRDNKAERRIADDSDIKRQLPFLKNLEPYSTATRVQFSFRRWSGYISSVPREQAKPEWNTAGGLAGVQGWSSQLYRKAAAREYLGYMPDGAITWQRSYDDGSTFAEVLRNQSGKVFEVRVAEKENGRWSRYVAHRDKAAMPPGYVPVRLGACAECHAKAGELAYGGSPAVPGGDTIISAPIGRVESGETVQGGFGLQL